MLPDVKKFLVDILLSVDIILEYLTDVKSYAEFAKNKMAVDAIERRLAIIGEALAKAIKADDTITVSDSKKIIGLRHILVHDYDLVDEPIIWKIINVNIPVLKKEVAILLQQD